MQFSYNLLSELVDLSGLTPAKVVDRLTFAGFEVEGVKEATRADKVVSGHVVSCVPHPDSDHLHVLKVDLGPKYGVSQIVCGAPNVKAGMNVIVALPGCDLPALGEKIKKSVIRGQESNGMCCALYELGLPKEVLPKEETEGIHDLGADYRPGDEQVLAHLGLEDTLLEVNVLPNRPDCYCYVGLARELGALLDRKAKPVEGVDLSALPDAFPARIQTKDVARFDLLGATLGPKVDSAVALRIKRWLWLSGLHSVSPLVDLGNFVMLLTGQPFHIYDLDKTDTQGLWAKEGYQGPFRALDGKTYGLEREDIVIADDKGEPLCLGGVMGGMKTMDGPRTQRVAIEAACFYHVNIRHTCARLGLSSGSSALFAKGVNPRLADKAESVFAHWLKSVFPAASLTSFATSGERPLPNKPFAFSLAKLNHRLGTAYTQEEVDRVLKAYQVVAQDGGRLVAPWWRVDLNEQADIDEEVFRFYPANRVPLSYDGLPLTEGGLSETQLMTEKTRDFLQGLGLSEILTFTLVDEKESKAIRVFDDGDAYRIQNPLTKDHEYVRVDLLPSLVVAMERNIARKHEDLAFYEISSIDTKKGVRRFLSFGFNGNRPDQGLYGARAYDFFDLKAVVTGLLALFGIHQSRVRLIPSVNPSFHPGKAADLFLGKQPLGTFGALNPKAFPKEYLVGEIDLGALEEIRTGKAKFVPFGQYPTVRRDLSFTLAGPVDYQQIALTAQRASKGLLKDVELFDYYVEPKTAAKSLGIALFLGADDHTLTDKETDGEVAAILTALIAKLPLVAKK